MTRERWFVSVLLFVCVCVGAWLMLGQTTVYGPGVAEINEAVAFFAATDITGAQAETLTDGSTADSLHDHTLAGGATDVTSTAAELNKLDGASANVTAANLNTLTGTGDADALHTHALKLDKALTSAYLFVGNASNMATGVASSGDVTNSNTGVWTLNDAHAEQVVLVALEDLAAGADVTDRPIFVHPRANTQVSMGILTQGAPAGVDDGNTVVITVADDADNTIVTKTYNTANQPPSSDYGDLGALDGTHKVLTATEHVTITITQGATADLSALMVVLRFIPTNS